MACMQNEVDFEIFMYFIIYRELSLSRLNELITNKSKPTLHRHLQNLLQAGIIVEAREEKVRGHIPAKIYQLSQLALNFMPHYSQEQIENMM